MKKIYFLSLVLVFVTILSAGVKAQTTYTKQVIIVSGGIYSDPNDFVTISSYNPETETSTEFGTIYTQSVQDVIINGSFAYVAAQDSIVKFNIDTYEKLASVASPGINQLATDGNVLLASFWYPVTDNFVKIFSLEDLSLVANIEGVSGDAAGFLIHDGIALVAIPGPYGSTTGKIAAIDINQAILLSEDDYGDFYSGINFFGFYNDVISSFMTTAWGETNTNIGTFDYSGDILEQYTINDANLANSAGQRNNLMYIELNNGIAEYDLNDNTETMIVSPLTESIAASVIDTINNNFYITTSDFFSYGNGYIYNFEGNQTSTIDVGISAQAIAVDYRTTTSINDNINDFVISVYPNPAGNYIKLHSNKSIDIENIDIIDNLGRVVLSANNDSKIDVSNLNTGIYFVIVHSKYHEFSSRFIKN